MDMSEATILTTDPDQSDEGTFSIGPPEAVTDSRQLPAVSAEDEAHAVHGSDLGDAHPDNRAAEGADLEVAALEPDEDAGEALPSDEELASLVADVDVTAVDEVGYDDGDVEALFDPTSDDVPKGSV